MDLEAIVELINQKLVNKPLIYFAREAVRGIGLEDLFDNYHIACIEHVNLVDQLIEKGHSVFCLEKEGEKLSRRSTLALLGHEKAKAWVKRIAPEGFYALTFSPSKTIEHKIRELDGSMLQTVLDVSLEDKINQYTFFRDFGITKLPATEIATLTTQTFEDLQKKFGSPFIMQTAKSHTGLGTFIIHNEITYEDVKSKYSGNVVKFSEFIRGKTLTINGVIDLEGNIEPGALQLQITAAKEFSLPTTMTIGNDFSYGKNLMETNREVNHRVTELLEEVGMALHRRGFIGVFGIDCIWDDTEIYLIEINPRQTANMTFETALTRLQTQDIPLLLLQIGHFLGISISFNSAKIKTLEGAQIFLRSNNNITLRGEHRSGFYKLQGDNSAFHFSEEGIEQKDDVLFIDEEGDKPLIFTRDGYRFQEVNALLLCMFQKEGSEKKSGEELARVQTLDQIVYNNDISPWVKELYISLSKQLYK